MRDMGLLSIALSCLMLVQQGKIAPRPATAPAVDEIIFRGFPFGQKATRAQVEALFGQGKSVSEQRVSGNPAVVLQFEGVTVSLVEGKDHTTTVSTIDLTDNRWNFPAKLRIGSTRQEVLKLLGKADIEHPGELIYGCYECVWDHKVHFFFDGDKVKRIQWDFYLG